MSTFRVVSVPKHLTKVVLTSSGGPVLVLDGAPSGEPHTVCLQRDAVGRNPVGVPGRRLAVAAWCRTVTWPDLWFGLVGPSQFSPEAEQ